MRRGSAMTRSPFAVTELEPAALFAAAELLRREKRPSEAAQRLERLGQVASAQMAAPRQVALDASRFEAAGLKVRGIKMLKFADALLREHHGEHVLRREERALHVHVEDAIPRRLRLPLLRPTPPRRSTRFRPLRCLHFRARSGS